jgi:hypothetical protein
MQGPFLNFAEYSSAVSDRDQLHGVGTLVRHAISFAFDKLLAKQSITTDVKVGAFGLRISATSDALSRAYSDSFVSDPPDQIDLSVAVLGPREIDLSDLIPQPPKRGRTLIDADCIAMWYADHLPVLYLLDRRKRQGIVWLAYGEAPDWELSRPACPLIHASLLEGSWTTVHGGAVGRNGRMLLLAGKGKSGKTTAALACVQAGWDYAGDDYVLANVHAGRVEPLYTSARLRIDMANSFASILPRASRRTSDVGGDVRHELALGDVLGNARTRGGRIAAILLPRRRGSTHPEFTPARRSDAFQALFISSSLSVPAPIKSTSQKLAALVGCAPVFFVDTGQHPANVPVAFDQLLKTL